jgi:hypothetical protein
MIGKLAGHQSIPLQVGPSVDLPYPGKEAYRLSYTGTGLLIEARAEEGVRRAIATRDQIARQYRKFEIPQMVIEDGPSFATRGVMLDVSRDRVPTMKHLLQTVDLMASLKFNHLQLYTEHTFAYAGHEEVWRDWSPLTPAEIRELDSHCRLLGIELAANQNCFGHLAKWLNHPNYGHLAETLGEWVFQNETESFPRSGPFSLCPIDPGSAVFVKDLLGQLLPCFSSHWSISGAMRPSMWAGDARVPKSRDAAEPRCTSISSTPSRGSCAHTASVRCSGRTSRSRIPRRSGRFPKA